MAHAPLVELHHALSQREPLRRRRHARQHWAAMIKSWQLNMLMAGIAPALSAMESPAATEAVGGASLRTRAEYRAG